MPFHDGRPEALRGPLVRIEVRLPAAARRALEKRGERLAVDHCVGLAVLDTGSSTTGISTRVVDKLGLKSINRERYAGVSGVIEDAPVYLVELSLPYPSDAPLVLPSLQVLGHNLAPQDLDGIIGRDVLSRGVLTFNGPAGTFRWEW